jgi:hypothetical protein
MKNTRIPRDRPEARAEARFAAWLPQVFQSRLGLYLRPARPTLARGTHRSNLVFTLDQDGSKRSLVVEVKSRWLRAYASEIAGIAKALREEGPEAILLLAVPALSDRAQHELRAIGVNYVDLTGTVYIREPGLYIDIGSPSVAGGSAEAFQEEPTIHLSSVDAVNPFTDAASMVLRLLLHDPSRAWRIQDLANAGAMSAGWVTTVARALESRGYATRSQHGSGRDSDLRIADPVATLQDWSAAYSWRANTIVSYSVPFEYSEILQRLPAICNRVGLADADDRLQLGLTLLSGAERYAAHVQHEQVHLYASAQALAPFTDLVQRTLHGEVVAQGGNLHVLQPYYRRSVFVHARIIGGFPVISPVQLYLDLIRYPVRGPEAATVLARAVLGPAWRLSPDQVLELSA